MTNSVSSARGKQLLNSLLTAAGLVGVVVAGVTFYANTKESRDADMSAHLSSSAYPTPAEASQPTPILDSELTSLGTEVDRSPNRTSPVQQSNSHWKDSYQTYQIPVDCNGAPSSGANFRQYPTLDSSAILGGVDAGQTIWLTGRRIKSDGVIWYEVINPTPLAPTIDSTVQNKLDAYQVGWIADCFLSR